MHRYAVYLEIGSNRKQVKKTPTTKTEGCQMLSENVAGLISLIR